MTAPTLLVMAAGMGSRYGGIKQMDPVGPSGGFILDYSVYDAWKAGFRKVVFVIRRELEEPLREHFGDGLSRKMKVEYVVQDPRDLPAGFSLPPTREKPWGTGQAVLAARDAIREPFGVINADDFYGRGAYETLAAFLGDESAAATDYCLVSYRLSNTLSKYGSVTRGICAGDAEGQLSSVVETHGIEIGPEGRVRYPDPKKEGAWIPLTGDEPASMNFWGFRPAAFGQFSELFTEFLRKNVNEPKIEFYVPTTVDELVSRGLCRTALLHTEERWFGMTYREDRPHVIDNILDLTRKGVYPEDLWK